MERKLLIRVGVPVEYHYQGDKADKKRGWMVKEGSKGIVTYVNADRYYFANYEYDVYWFSSGQILWHSVDDVNKCSGAMRGNKDYCSRCEFNELCPHMRKIVLCDVSMFRGKFNPDTCKQRKCKYSGICLTNRFTQNDHQSLAQTFQNCR